ncbi:MAG: hypothetical protein Q8M01_21110 [Rubrivivax sp.]|nr:hypothetical protein [Rubrivivax sp.]
MILLFGTEAPGAAACLYSVWVGLTTRPLVEIAKPMVHRPPTSGQDANRPTSIVEKGMT